VEEAGDLHRSKVEAMDWEKTRGLSESQERKVHNTPEH
jgi:hypothetical protein